MVISTTERVGFLTNQQIFDKVAHHLANQRVKCTDSHGSCMYRGKHPDTNDVTSCAVGCLIPDYMYQPEFDHVNLITDPYILYSGITDVNNLKDYEPFVEALHEGGVDITNRDTLKLLRALQSIHDQMEVYNDNTAECLASAAKRLGLDPSLVIRPC